MKKDSKNKLARSYAQAMLEAAEAAGAAENVLHDAQLLTAALKSDPAIARQLANPLWKIEYKQNAVREIGDRLKLNVVTVRSLQVAAAAGRLDLLSEILRRFVEDFYAANNIAEVSVTSATTLDQEQEKRLKQALEKRLGKKVVINYAIKPEILGGLLIECGSMMFDDSVKGKLNRLELLMKGTK